MPEHPALLVGNLDRYRAALDRICECTLFHFIFDVSRLRAAMDQLSRGVCDLGTAQSIDRVMDVGLFIAANKGIG